MKLSPFELEVMQIIWDEGEAVAPDVHRKLAQDRKVTYSSVKTMFDRLEEKGAIKRLRTYGRTILYGPAISKDQVARPLVKDFMQRMFSGHVRPLVSHALADEKLTSEDIDYLETLLARRKQALEDQA